jgi:hypothetical protein
MKKYCFLKRILTLQKQLNLKIMDTSAGLIGGFVIFVIVAVLLFLLFRFVMLWYWRINDIIDLLTKQLNNQREILKHLTGEKQEEPEETKKEAPIVRIR